MAEESLPPRQIPLGKTGLFALVDAADYEYLSQWKWSTCHNKNTRYAKRTTYKDGVYGAVLMHRLIMGPGNGQQTDHRDGDGLNNQRYNLRVCTKLQNSRNRKTPNGNPLFKGVRRISNGKYRALVTCDGKHYHLGYFDDAANAATAYNFHAAEMFGEFARFNIPKQ